MLGTKNPNHGFNFAVAALACVTGLALIAGGDEAATPSKNTGDAMTKSVLRTPPGPPWPDCWDYQFTAPESFPVGKPFTVAIRITPLLFDVKDLTVAPDAGGGPLKLVKGDPDWKGSLKKGEAKTFELTLLAPTNGYNGQYGVLITSTNFYRELRAYIQAQQEGPYKSAEAQASIIRRIDADEKEFPQYDEWVGGGVDTTAASTEVK